MDRKVLLIRWDAAEWEHINPLLEEGLYGDPRCVHLTAGPPPEKGPKLTPLQGFPNELTEAHILPFIPEAAKIDQKKDKRLSSLAKVLSHNASVHAVATALMRF
jgi:hypothetical protein